MANSKPKFTIDFEYAVNFLFILKILKFDVKVFKFFNESLTINNVKVVQKCNKEHETKIQEALFIKKQNPKLNS